MYEGVLDTSYQQMIDKIEQIKLDNIKSEWNGYMNNDELGRIWFYSKGSQHVMMRTS